MSHAMQSSFDFVGDGDDVDLIALTERIFGITITDAEAERVETFGDLLVLIDRKSPLPARLSCHLREMIKRVREAFAPIRPSTPLSDLIAARDPLAALTDLSQRTNLDLVPQLPFARGTARALTAISAAIVLASVAFAIQIDSATPLAATTAWSHATPRFSRRGDDGYDPRRVTPNWETGLRKLPQIVNNPTIRPRRDPWPT